MSARDIPIDLVYLYVNGSDKEWIARRQQYTMDFNNGVCRFRDNNELMYSLRSVEQYAPWIRNIYIVSDSAMPDWLNVNHPKLHFVDFPEIMPSDILPVFNSNVIEAHLYRIPELSEFFLYSNDDMFFGKNVSPDFFVKDGKPVVRMIKRKITASKSLYGRFIQNSQKAIFDHYGKKLDLVPWHNIDVYTKTGMEKCVKEFHEEFQAFFHNRTRGENDLQRTIFHYDLLSRDECVLKTYDWSTLVKRLFNYFRMYLFPSKYLDGFRTITHRLFQVPLFRQFYFRHPYCACINDSEETTEEDLIQYQLLMKKLFPQKSSFEK